VLQAGGCIGIGEDEEVQLVVWRACLGRLEGCRRADSAYRHSYSEVEEAVKAAGVEGGQDLS